MNASVKTTGPQVANSFLCIKPCGELYIVARSIITLHFKMQVGKSRITRMAAAADGLACFYSVSFLYQHAFLFQVIIQSG